MTHYLHVIEWLLTFLIDMRLVTIDQSHALKVLKSQIAHPKPVDTPLSEPPEEVLSQSLCLQGTLAERLMVTALW